jgi:hypothetical protein
MNLKFLLKQEGKCSCEELMQRAQVIEKNVLETGANILDPSKLLQDIGGKDLKVNFDERHIFFFISCF